MFFCDMLLPTTPCHMMDLPLTTPKQVRVCVREKTKELLLKEPCGAYANLLFTGGRSGALSALSASSDA
jgi:hypothetical protein